MSRREFSKATKRAAVARAKGRCDASGPVYGLGPEAGCWADLGHGFEIDHYPLPATMEGSDSATTPPTKVFRRTYAHEPEEEIDD